MTALLRVLVAALLFAACAESIPDGTSPETGRRREALLDEPAITSPASASAIVGYPFVYVVTASGLAPLSLTVTGAPAWASFNAATGELTGTPTADGTFVIGLEAANGLGVAAGTLTLVVRTAAVVTSATEVDAVVGLPFSYHLEATGTPLLQLSVTSLPSWAAFDADTGWLTGIPTSEGEFTLGLWARNDAATDAKSLVITSRTRPQITSLPFATAIVGEAFSFELTSSGTPARVVSATDLPAWLSFDAGSGLLRGTPPADGDFLVSVVVTNAAGVDTQHLAITARTRPALTTPRLVHGVIGKPLGFRVAATGSAPVLLSAQALPPGLTLAADWIGGVPTQAGTFEALVRGANTAGSYTTTVSFEIRQVVPAPTIELPADGAVLGARDLTIAGSAPAGEVGATVEVSEGNLVVCLATVSSDGSWGCQGSSFEGAHELTAVLIDVNGFMGTVVDTLHFRIDLTAPTPPQWQSPHTGPSANARPALTGAGEPGAFVEVSFNGQLVCLAWVGAEGTWACTPSAPLPEGRVVLELSQRDAAGNAMTGASLTLEIDTHAPARPQIDSPLHGSVVATAWPTISGLAEPQATVRVYLDGPLLCTVTVSPEGTFECRPASALAEGAHEVRVTSSDAAGNSSREGATSFLVDALGPAAPQILSPTGRVGTDAVTIIGAAEPAATVSVTLDGVSLCVTTAAASGAFSCRAQGLSEGWHAVTAFARDAVGHESAVASARFEVQTATGSMSPMGTMLTTQLAELCGSATPGATVNVYVDGAHVGSTTATAEGSWCFELPSMSAGMHSLSIGVANASGHEVYRTPDARVAVEAPADPRPGSGCSATSQAPAALFALLAAFLRWRRRRVR